MPRALALLVLAITTGVALPAAADRSAPPAAGAAKPGQTAGVRAERKVFLNGVALGDTEVTDQTFTGCTVRFDAHGDLHISAPGLKVEKLPDAAPASPSRPSPAAAKPSGSSSTLTQRYFLVAEESPAGTTGLEVAIEINGREVATVRSGDPSANGAIEVTQHVRPGDNQVRLTTRKLGAQPSGSRTRAPEHQLRIQIGEGRSKDGTVTVTRAVLEYRRTAADTRSAAATYRFVAR